MPTQNQASAPLVVRNLTLHRGKVEVLTDLDLDVHKGDVLGLIGLNGVGKTSTLRCLAGLISPSNGSVHIAGLDLIANPVQARQHIGFLSDPPALHDDLRVERHLQAMASLFALPRSERAQAVERVLTLTGLEDVHRMRIAHLSQGYRQRVGLAQALLHTPDLVLLDEPTNGLDLAQQDAFSQTIRHIAKDAAVILSSHHMSDLRGCCNRTAQLEGGVLLEHTSPSQDAAFSPYFIRLRQPLSDVELCAAPGIVSASPDRDGWMVEVSGDITAVSAYLSDRQWGLVQLSPILPQALPSDAFDRSSTPQPRNTVERQEVSL